MNKLWYKNPAKDWNEALPLGNGRLGAMVFGGVYHESLQLNEDSIWYGRHKDRHNPDAFDNLEKVRKLIAQERFDEANQLVATAMTAVPESQSHYEPLGDIFLTFEYPDEDGKVNVGKWANRAVMHKIKDYNISLHSDYKRTLDLEKATVEVSYSVHGIRYTRTSFISYPDNALVVNIKADKPNSIYVWTQISRQRSRYIDYTGKFDDNTLIMNGDCGKGGIEFASALRASAKGGYLKTQGQYCTIEGADEVTLKLVADTTFRTEKPHDSCMKRLEVLENKNYKDLLEAHLQDYTSLNKRSSIKIEDIEDKCSIPTDERLERIKSGENDPQMIGLYYEFGKYLTISASRPGSLPSNLQGIWNDLMKPPWDSKYTININFEMNYWPTNIMNISECAYPFFDLLERLRENGKITAQRLYGCRGFTAHHNTDIWADSVPQDACMSASYWAMGAAWMSTHIYEHYLFTKDIDFLSEKFDTMLDAALFLLDFIYEDEKGNLVTSPSVSPENSFKTEDGQISAICQSPSMDFQIIRLLFSQCIKGAEILDREDDVIVQEIKATLSRIPAIKVSSDGRIMEWDKEYEEVYPGHRHMSHLFALYPDCQISPKTPELWAAARASLEYRLSNDGGATGWSRAWIINFWARLLDEKQVYNNVQALLATSSYPNLFDKHAPFQIDGNFGGASGIAEALIQSHSNELYLLPALPKAWGKGKACGLRARGGLSIDISFDDGKLVYADICADSDNEVIIRVNEDIKISCIEKSLSKTLDNTYRIKLDAQEKVRLVGD